MSHEHGGAGGGRFIAFTSHNYRRYFIGLTASHAGTWMSRVAQAWLVLDLTGSPAALGTVTAFQSLPMLFLIPSAGVIADRLPKRTLIRLVQLGFLLQAAAMAILSLSNTIELWQIYLLALALGCISAFDQTARFSFVGEVVDRARLQSAVSLTTTISNLAKIVGPSIAGIVIAVASSGWCFALNVVMQLVAMASFMLMRSRELHPAEPATRGSASSQLMDGLRYTASEPLLLLPLVFEVFVGIFILNWPVVLPLVARYGLGSDSVGLGVLSTTQAIGSIIGSIIIAGTAPPRPIRLFLNASAVTVSVGALAFAPSFITAMGLIFVVGIIQTSYMASTHTMIQLTAKSTFRGRVLSLNAMAHHGTTPIGSAFIGILAGVWDIRVALLVASTLCLAGLVGTWIMLRHRIPSSLPVAMEPVPAK